MDFLASKRLQQQASQYDISWNAPMLPHPGYRGCRTEPSHTNVTGSHSHPYKAMVG